MRCHKYSRSFGSIDRVDRWVVSRVLASLLPKPPPSHKPRRRLNSSSTPGPVDCARAVWRETPSWVPFGAAPPQVTRPYPPDNLLQTVPFLIARYDDARAKHTHVRALRRRRRSLARSLARAVCGGCGGGGGRLHTSPVTRVTRAARHARVRVRHHRASRASSPPTSPISTMRARGVRSLAHLLLRTSPRRTPHVRA